jgi:hypothetical protein
VTVLHGSVGRGSPLGRVCRPTQGVAVALPADVKDGRGVGPQTFHLCRFVRACRPGTIAGREAERRALAAALGRRHASRLAVDVLEEGRAQARFPSRWLD